MKAKYQHNYKQNHQSNATGQLGGGGLASSSGNGLKPLKEKSKKASSSAAKNYNQQQMSGGNPLSMVQGQKIEGAASAFAGSMAANGVTMNNGGGGASMVDPLASSQKQSTKIVNLSFAGQEVAPRNMSSSLYNGFYVNAAALEADPSFKAVPQANGYPGATVASPTKQQQNPNMGAAQLLQAQQSQNTGSMRALTQGSRPQQPGGQPQYSSNGQPANLHSLPQGQQPQQLNGTSESPKLAMNDGAGLQPQPAKTSQGWSQAIETPQRQHQQYYQQAPMQGQAPQAMGPGAYLPTSSQAAAQAHAPQRNRFYAKQQSLPKQPMNPAAALQAQQQYYSSYNSHDRDSLVSPEMANQQLQQQFLNGQLTQQQLIHAQLLLQQQQLNDANVNLPNIHARPQSKSMHTQQMQAQQVANATLNGVFGVQNQALQQTPMQKKTVSSKGNNRRKISANQSAQMGGTTQILQHTINYPSTMKKKSSKANMLENNGPPTQYTSGSLSRTTQVSQAQKLQQNLGSSFKRQQQYMGAVQDDLFNYNSQQKELMGFNNNLTQQQAVETAWLNQMLAAGYTNEQIKLQFANYAQSVKKPTAEYQLVQAFNMNQTPNGFKNINPTTQFEQQVLDAGILQARSRGTNPTYSAQQTSKLSKDYVKPGGPAQLYDSQKFPQNAPILSNQGQQIIQQNQNVQSQQLSLLNQNQQPQFHGRKLIQVKAPSEFALAQNQLLQNQEAQVKSALGQPQGMFTAQVSSPQPSGAKHRSQYVVPESAKSNQANRNQPETSSPFEVRQNNMQRQNVNDRNVEMSQTQSTESRTPIVLHQSQIVYAADTSPITQNNGGGSSQKNNTTSMVVRIDNSSNQQHLITKKKGRNTKDIPQGSVSEQGTPEEDSLSNEQQKVMKIYSGDRNNEQDQATPVVFDSSADADTNLRVELRSMSQSAQINPILIKSQGGSALNTLNTLSNAPATLMVPQEAAEGEEYSPMLKVDQTDSAARITATIQPFKDSNAPDPAAELQASNTVPPANETSTIPLDSNQEENELKPIPQIELLGAELSTYGTKMNKEIREELAARDLDIGIDEEDAHHQDFEDDEVSCASVYSHALDDAHNNQSVDSDNVGGMKQGPRSHRQSNLSDIHKNNIKGQTQAGTNADSDMESEKSGPAPHYLTMYQSVNAANNNTSLNMLASDSETDNFSDTGSQLGTIVNYAHNAHNNDDIDGISEHSSDDEDSDDEEPLKPGEKKVKSEKKNADGTKPKKKKTKEEKQGGKSKKNKDEKAAESKGTKKDKDKNVAVKTHKNFTEDKQGAGGKDSKLPQPKQAVKNKSDVDHKHKNKLDKELSQIQMKKQSSAQKSESTKASMLPKKAIKEESRKDGDTIKQKDKKKDAEAEESPKKKKQNKLNMALIHTLPKNIEEQQELFFSNDCKVNPQFEYENYALTQKFMQQYKEPSEEFLDLAIKILESFIAQYGSESLYLETEGDILTQEETEQIINEYLEELEFKELLGVQFKARQVAPTSVTHDPKTGKSTINVRTPCEYRRGRMHGVLDHEIGTHYMRRYNEKFQVWYKKRQQFDMKPCIKTEEGFACVNQLVRTAWDKKHPYLYRSALNYYAACKAAEMSFVELFNDIEKFIDNKMSRWKFTLRLKRGMQDTSEPGGLYKDQVYLEGAVTVLQNRKTLDFYGLLCGKISYDDLTKPNIAKKLEKEKIKLPPYIENMDEYMAALDIIAKTNHIPEKGAPAAPEHSPVTHDQANLNAPNIEDVDEPEQ